MGSTSKKRTSIGQQIKNRLYQFGYIPADSIRKMSQKWIKELQAVDLGYELNISIKILGELWFELTEKITEMNKYLQEQAKSQSSLETIYRSVPGIGPTSSRELANELGDMQHFSSERGLFSYTGLTPYEYSSGETKRLGHITRCGRGQLRRILIEAAWYAVRHDPGLATIYKRIALRAGAKRAIVAIARKLVGRIRACFKHGMLYEMGVM